MIPRYPFIVVVHYRAETKRPIVSRQFDTLAAAFAMREENIGRKGVHKIILGLELDVAEAGGHEDGVNPVLTFRKKDR